MAIVISGKTEGGREAATLGTISKDIAANQFYVYTFSVTQTGTLTVYTAGGTDTMLSIFDRDETAQLAYNDDSPEVSLDARIENLALSQTGTYYIVLECYSSNSGNTSLTVEFTVSSPVNPLTPTPQPVSNIKIGYANLIDSSTLSATGVSENLPILNLKTLARGQIFRGTASSQTIEITFASPALVGCVALWFPTFTWLETDGFDAQIYNGASVVHTVTNALKSAFFTEVVATKVVLTIRAGMIFDLSRVFIGRVFTPTHNLEFGFGTKYHDLSENQRSEDGSLHIQKKAKYRQLTISLADITHADRAQLVRMVQNSGTQKEVFVSIFNQNDERDGDNGLLRQDHELLGIFEDGAEISLTSPNRWNNKLVINEL